LSGHRGAKQHRKLKRKDGLILTPQRKAVEDKLCKTWICFLDSESGFERGAQFGESKGGGISFRTVKNMRDFFPAEDI
jgi:hypothetical protein